MKLMVKTPILCLFISTATVGQEAVKNIDNTIFVYVKKSLSQNVDNNNYFVSVVDGKIKEELLPAEIIKE